MSNDIATLPPLPPGFELEQDGGDSLPPLPPGFELEAGNPPAGGLNPAQSAGISPAPAPAPVLQNPADPLARLTAGPITPPVQAQRATAIVDPAAAAAYSPPTYNSNVRPPVAPTMMGGFPMDSGAVQAGVRARAQKKLQDDRALKQRLAAESQSGDFKPEEWRSTEPELYDAYHTQDVALFVGDIGGQQQTEIAAGSQGPVGSSGDPSGFDVIDLGNGQTMVKRRLARQFGLPGAPEDLYAKMDQERRDAEGVAKAAEGLPGPTSSSAKTGLPGTKEELQHLLGIPTWQEQGAEHIADRPGMTSGGKAAALEAFRQQGGNTKPSDTPEMIREKSKEGQSRLAAAGAGFYGDFNRSIGSLLGLVNPGAGRRFSESATDTFGEPTGVAGMAGSVAQMATVAAATGHAAPIVFALEASGGARVQAQQQRRAGVEVSGKQEATAAITHGALAWAITNLNLNKLAPAAGARLRVLVPTLVKAAQAGDKAAIGSALKEITRVSGKTALLSAGDGFFLQLAGNLVDRATLDPSRDPLHGTGEAAASMALLTMGMGVLHGLEAVPKYGPTLGKFAKLREKFQNRTLTQEQAEAAMNEVARTGKPEKTTGVGFTKEDIATINEIHQTLTGEPLIRRKGVKSEAVGTTDQTPWSTVGKLGAEPGGATPDLPAMVKPRPRNPQDLADAFPKPAKDAVGELPKSPIPTGEQKTGETTAPAPLAEKPQAGVKYTAAGYPPNEQPVTLADPARHPPKTVRELQADGTMKPVEYVTVLTGTQRFLEVRKDSLTQQQPEGEGVKPAAMAVGEKLRVMKEPSVLDQSQDVEGIRYELFKSEKGDDAPATIRVTDIDTGKVTTLKQHPTFAGAAAEFSKSTGTAVAAKEPWQMTRDEYANTAVDDRTMESLRWGTDPKRFDPKRFNDAADKRERARDLHRAAVQQALKAGKPVPANVLADYPDLPRAASIPELPEMRKPRAQYAAQDLADAMPRDTSKLEPAGDITSAPATPPTPQAGISDNELADERARRITKQEEALARAEARNLPDVAAEHRKNIADLKSGRSDDSLREQIQRRKDSDLLDRVQRGEPIPEADRARLAGDISRRADQAVANLRENSSLAARSGLVVDGNLTKEEANGVYDKLDRAETWADALSSLGDLPTKLYTPTLAHLRDYWFAVHSGRSGTFRDPRYTDAYPMKSLEGQAAPGPAKDDESQIVSPIDRNASDEVKQQQLAKLTEANVPIVQELIGKIDAQFGTRSKFSEKLPDRVIAKANRPSIKAKKPWFGVEHVRDALRFKSVLPDFTKVPDILQEVLNTPGVELVKLDTDKMLRPKEWGWRFVAFDLRMPNGQLVEYYLPLQEQEAAKKAGNHKLFEKWRNHTEQELYEQREEYQRDLEESNRLYGEGWSSALSRLGLSESEAVASWNNIVARLESLTRSKLSLRSSAVNSRPVDQVPPSRTAANLPASTITRPSDLSSVTSTEDVSDGPFTNISVPEHAPKVPINTPAAEPGESLLTQLRRKLAQQEADGAVDDRLLQQIKDLEGQQTPLAAAPDAAHRPIKTIADELRLARKEGDVAKIKALQTELKDAHRRKRGTLSGDQPGATNVPESQQTAADDRPGGDGRGVVVPDGGGETVVREPAGDGSGAAVPDGDAGRSGGRNPAAQSDAEAGPAGRGPVEDAVREPGGGDSAEPSTRVQPSTGPEAAGIVAHERPAKPTAAGSNFLAPAGSLTRQGSWPETARRNVEIIRLAGLKSEIEKLNRLQGAHHAEQQEVQYKLEQARSAARFHEGQLKKVAKAIEDLGNAETWAPEVKIGGKVIEKAGEIGDAVKAALEDLDVDQQRDIGTVGGFTLTASNSKMIGFTLNVQIGGQPWQAYKFESLETVNPPTIGQYVRRGLTEPESEQRRLTDQLADERKEIKKYEGRFGAPFERQAELAQKITEAAQLERELYQESQSKAADRAAKQKAAKDAQQQGQPATPAASTDDQSLGGADAGESQPGGLESSRNDVRDIGTSAVPAPEDAESGGMEAKVQPPNSPRIPVAPLSGGSGKRLDQISLELQHAVGHKIRNAKAPRGAAGVYMPNSTRIAVRKPGDLDTIGHEVAHFYDDKFGIVGRWAKPRARSPYDSELIPNFSGYGSVKKSGPKSMLWYQRAEGVAEWLRAWMFNPAAAEAAAPKFTAFVKRSVPADELAKLRAFGDDVRRWAGESAAQRQLSNIQIAPESQTLTDKLREPFKKEPWSFSTTWLDKLDAAVRDHLSPVMKAIAFAKRLNTTAGPTLPERDPETLMRLLPGFNDKYTEMLNSGLVDPRLQPYVDGKTGKPLTIDWLYEPLDRSSTAALEKDAKLTIALGVSERVVEKATIFRKEVEDKIDAMIVAAGHPSGYVPVAGDPLFDRIVKLRHAVELRVQRLAGTGGGIFSDEQQAQAAITELAADPKTFDRIKEAVRRYRVFARGVLTYYRDSGRLSKEAFDNIVKQNEFYFDFHRIIDTITPRPGGVSGKIGTAAQPLKRFKGSTRLMENPYVNLLEGAYKMYREADRNKAVGAFVELIDSTRKMYAGTPIDFDAIGSKAMAGDPDTIPYYRKGHLEHWQFEPLVHTALKGFFQTTDHNLLWQLLKLPATMIRGFVTHSPPFLVRNIIRDAQNRAVVSEHGGKPWDIFTHSPSGPDARKFRLGGGEQFGHYLGSAEAWHKELAIRMKEMAGDKSTLLMLPGRAIRGWHALSKSSELVGRMAEYRRAYEHATTPTAAGGLGYDDTNATMYAAAHSRDLLDFAISGYVVKQINQIIPFFNAAVQGPARAYKAAKNDPRGAILRWATYVLAPALLTYLWNLASGNGEEYRQLPPYRRDFFYNLKLGHLWISIPKPFEIGVMASGVERVIDTAMGEKNAMAGYPADLAKSLLPVDESAMVGPLKGFIENSANHSFFFDRSVIPTYEAGRDLKLRDTSRASRLGKAMQWVTEQVGYGVDARMIDNLVYNYTAGVGRLAQDVSDIGRKDRQAQRFLASGVGLFTFPPAYASNDVQVAMQLASSLGDQNSRDVRQLSDLLRAQQAARTLAERDSLAKNVRSYAKQLRAHYEHNWDALLAEKQAAAGEKSASR